MADVKTASADLQEETRRKDEAVRQSIMERLSETGEKDRLKEMVKAQEDASHPHEDPTNVVVAFLKLREKLVECGWRDELKEYCKEVIRSKGLEKITVDELVEEITPRGRATVPDNIKAELLQRIRRFLQTT